MKKIYQIPTVEVVRVSPCQMIAASLGASEKPANEEGGMLAKEGWVMWSDDEPEEVDY